MSVLTVGDVQSVPAPYLGLACEEWKPHPPRSHEGGVCKTANAKLQFLALVLGEYRRSKPNTIIWLRPSTSKRNRLVPAFIDAFDKMLKIIYPKDGQVLGG